MPQLCRHIASDSKATPAFATACPFAARSVAGLRAFAACLCSFHCTGFLQPPTPAGKMARRGCGLWARCAAERQAADTNGPGLKISSCQVYGGEIEYLQTLQPGTQREYESLGLPRSNRRTLTLGKERRDRCGTVDKTARQGIDRTAAAAGCLINLRVQVLQICHG